jgi:hypothetical protein
MSTKWKVNPFLSVDGLQTGLEGIDIPEDFEMPSCGIEDVDRAMFRLFNEDLPFYYTQGEAMKRIPCVFAGGERAMILRKKEPLRDRQGALVLPLVSILRNGIDQTADKGIGPGTGSITLRKKIAQEDRIFKRLSNQNNLRNQDNTVGSTGEGSASLDLTSKNVYEIITMPNPRFFKATYEITFWAQYLQQMNSIIEAFITSYNNSTARSFKIETNKGYWFVATVESGLSDSNNFDGYQDDERLIKTSITMSVTGYIINPQFPGAPKVFRRYVSAPKVQFDTTVAKPDFVASSKIPSGDPDDYVFDDFNTERQPLPGKAIAMVDLDGEEYSVNIGGAIRDNTDNKIKMLKKLPQNVAKPTETVSLEDPFTGEPSKATVKSKNLSKGETVYIIIETLIQ